MRQTAKRPASAGRPASANFRQFDHHDTPPLERPPRHGESPADAELIPACEQVGVDLLPYFPLEYGLLTGKYRRGQAAPAGSRLAIPAQAQRLEGADFDRIEALTTYADERGISLLDVAIGGLVAQPFVGSVIAGVTTPGQVKANVEAGRWLPDQDDLDALDEVTAWDVAR